MAHQTIVIGAGLAGLSAAYELVRAGCDVQAFEARQRLGGRVHTVQLTAGQYGEGGESLLMIIILLRSLMPLNLT